jgi:hypothetical protein
MTKDPARLLRADSDADTIERELLASLQHISVPADAKAAACRARDRRGNGCDQRDRGCSGERQRARLADGREDPAQRGPVEHHDEGRTDAGGAGSERRQRILAAAAFDAEPRSARPAACRCAADRRASQPGSC